MFMWFTFRGSFPTGLSFRSFMCTVNLSGKGVKNVSKYLQEANTLMITDFGKKKNYKVLTIETTARPASPSKTASAS